MVLNGTPLEHYFEERAVDMRDLAPGIRVPWRFSDPRAEHLATRRAAGLFDFSFIACMEIKGDESLDLLHAVQTRNLATLPVGGIRYTLLLRDDGTVLNDATVWRTGERAFLLFVGRREDLEPVAARAQEQQGTRAYFGLGCEISTLDPFCSGHLAVLALQGPSSRDILAFCLEVPENLGYFRFAQSRFAGHPALVARVGYSGEAGYEVVLASNSGPALWEALRHAGRRHGLQESGFAAADTLRIEAGHILFTNELTLRVTPEELRLARLVEVEQPHRMRKASNYEPERCLAGLYFDAQAPAPLPAVDGEVTVTSACRSPTLQRSIGLAYVPWRLRHSGTRLKVCGARATVARLPFYDPGKSRPRTFLLA